MEDSVFRNRGTEHQFFFKYYSYGIKSLFAYVSLNLGRTFPNF